jgi:hypothetical protein
MSKKINRSGVIPYIIEEGQIKLLFMMPSCPKFGGDQFQIAKGKQEDDESALEAGLREASEELGLFVGNVTETYDLGTFMGRTTIHVAKIKDKDMFGDPHFETKSVRWMTPEEFEAEGRDLHKPVVKAAVRLIQEKEGYNEHYEILESYNTTREINWNRTLDKNGFQRDDGNFELGDEHYNITLLYSDLNVQTRLLSLTQVSFQRTINGNNQIQLTNSAHPSQVLGIIYNAVLEKLQNTEVPDIIVLSAKDDNDEKDLKILQKRINLYYRIASQVEQHGKYYALREKIKSKFATNIVLIKNGISLTSEELGYIKSNI